MNPGLEGEVRAAVRSLLADRHSVEARALFVTLAGYVDRRVGSLIAGRCADLIGAAEGEEITSEVLMDLMVGESGALSSFRGNTIGELYGFVRAVTDRAVWRRARKRLRERTLLEGGAGESLRAWGNPPPAADEAVEMVVESPFQEADAAWLSELLLSGSRAEMARRKGVSRAAVTQRVQRIRARIEAMEPASRAAAEAWLHREAEVALQRGQAGEP